MIWAKLFLKSLFINFLMMMYISEKIWTGTFQEDSILYRDEVGCFFVIMFSFIGFLAGRKEMIFNPIVLGTLMSTISVCYLRLDYFKDCRFLGNYFVASVIAFSAGLFFRFLCWFGGRLARLFFPFLCWLLEKCRQKNEVAPKEANYNSAIDINKANLVQKDKAKHVLAFIDRPSTQHNSVNIGIQGGWGTGKTSVINIMRAYGDKNYRKNNQIKLKKIDEEIAHQYESSFYWLEFNPFFYSDALEIRKKFLQAIEMFLSRNIGLDSVRLNYAQYINSLSNLHPFLGFFVNIVSPKDDQYMYQVIAKKIRDKLRELKKKVVIVVDDLDRLQSEELYEVLRLTKVLNDFGGFYFIFAYDSNALVKILSNPNSGIMDEGTATNFLPKFIQREFNLLKPDIDFICHTFKKEISNLLENWLYQKKEYKDISNLQEKQKAIDEKINFILKSLPLSSSGMPHEMKRDFQKYIKNIREIKFIALQFVSVYAHLEPEINAEDVFVLQVINKLVPEDYNRITTLKEALDPKVVTDWENGSLKSFPYMGYTSFFSSYLLPDGAENAPSLESKKGLYRITNYIYFPKYITETNNVTVDGVVLDVNVKPQVSSS